MGRFVSPGVILCIVSGQKTALDLTLAAMRNDRPLALALSVLLLAAIGSGTAATLIGASLNTHHWGELTTPALLVAGLLAFGLGSLVFTRPRRRIR